MVKARALSGESNGFVCALDGLGGDSLRPLRRTWRKYKQHGSRDAIFLAQEVASRIAVVSIDASRTESAIRIVAAGTVLWNVALSVARVATAVVTVAAIDLA